MSTSVFMTVFDAGFYDDSAHSAACGGSSVSPRRLQHDRLFPLVTREQSEHVIGELSGDRADDEGPSVKTARDYFYMCRQAASIRARSRRKTSCRQYFHRS